MQDGAGDDTDDGGDESADDGKSHERCSFQISGA
jgi:hypothetical protein